jgi:hypothetical protein
VPRDPQASVLRLPRPMPVPAEVQALRRPRAVRVFAAWAWVRQGAREKAGGCVRKTAAATQIQDR